MCGIFGFVGDAERAESVDLDAAIRSLRHRGPDGEGVHRELSRRNEAVGCALAHTRLAILDLTSAAAQPMTTDDGRFTLVYNGEIYNFRELRSELESQGERFGSAGDTEVLLKGLVRWKERAIERLQGMFAFGLWDRDDGSLLLGRDRLGVKPLYYAERPDGLAFASELRTLLATSLAERKLSPVGFSSYLAFGSVSEPHTIIEGIRALPPGHFASYRNGRLTLARYWSVSPPETRITDFDAAVREVRPILEQAVDARMVSDVPLGVFLSGGIDSSALVSLAARARQEKIRTFTVTFPDAAYSEAEHARAVAAHFGCEHHELHLSMDRATLDLDGAVASLDQPSADGLNSYFVSAAVRQTGLKVALSGVGGDELFAGYGNFGRFGRLLQASAALRPLSGALPPLQHALAMLPASLVPNQFHKVGALAAAGGRAGAVYGAFRAMFTFPQARRLVRDGLLRREGFEVGAAALAAPGERAPDAVNGLSLLELDNYMRNTLLRDTDVMSMAHGLEVRVPLLDAALVEACHRVHGDCKIARDGGNKPLLVAAVGDLPPDVGQRRKMGFTLPFELWFRQGLNRWLRDAYFGGEARAVRGLFEARRLDELWKAFGSGERYASWSRVWTIAALLRWCAANGVVT